MHHLSHLLQLYHGSTSSTSCLQLSAALASVYRRNRVLRSYSAIEDTVQMQSFQVPIRGMSAMSQMLLVHMDVWAPFSQLAAQACTCTAAGRDSVSARHAVRRARACGALHARLRAATSVWALAQLRPASASRKALAGCAGESLSSEWIAAVANAPRMLCRTATRRTSPDLAMAVASARSCRAIGASVLSDSMLRKSCTRPYGVRRRPRKATTTA